MTVSKQSIGSDLAKVDAYENTQADYDELPEITDEEFARAEPHCAGRPVRGRPPLGEKTKKQITLRLDEEVIAFFRDSGPGWQSQINAELREIMQSGRLRRDRGKRMPRRRS